MKLLRRYRYIFLGLCAIIVALPEGALETSFGVPKLAEIATTILLGTIYVAFEIWNAWNIHKNGKAE